jgi:precorrin-3B synthase
MSPAPASLRRGACPGVVDAMLANDGWLMRIRCPGGDITGDQLRAVAAVAARHGNGVVEITARANLQLRGISSDARTSAAATLIGGGLSHPDPVVDARRCVTGPALAGHDPAATVDAAPYVAAIVDALCLARFDAPLPAKLTVVVDDASPFGPADLTAHVVAVVTAERACADVAADVVRAVRRLAAMPLEPPAEVVRPTPPARHHGPVVGVHAHLDPDRASVIAAPPFGRLDPAQLTVLAALADHRPVRLTHRRGIAILGVARARVAATVARVADASLSADPGDPVHGVTACAGSPGCASSRSDTLAAAARLVDERRQRPGPHEPVHFSGCEKLCGAPNWAQVVLPE